MLRLLMAAVVLLASLLLAIAPASPGAARPDLKPTFLVDPPSAATQFSTAVRVVNSGTARAGSSKTELFLSRDGKSRDVKLGTLNTPRLRPGSSNLRGTRFDVPGDAAPGEYNLVACVDSGSAVRESREGNNCIGSAWTMTIGN